MASDDNDLDGFETEAKTPNSQGDVRHKDGALLLRRETVLSNERQRGALIAALCSLAGVGMGFGLGQFVSANNNCTHTSVVHETVSSTPNRPQAHAQAVTWLGVRVNNVARYRQVGTPAGAKVAGVFSGSPAEMLGLETDDVIVSFDSHQIVSSNTLIDAVRMREIGERVNIVWMRRNQQHRATIKLGSISPRSLRHLR